MPAETLPALTLHAPWAYAVTHLDKRIENRTWAPPPKLLGQRLAIHAGAASPAKARRMIDDLVGPMATEGCIRSAVVAVVTVVGYRDTRPGARHPAFGIDADALARAELATQDPLWLGPVGWLFRDVVALPEPVPCKWRLGVWRLSTDVDAKVRAQLAQTEAA